MDEIISYKMCAVKVRNAKLRNYLKWLNEGPLGADYMEHFQPRG
jgi:hypothetical protein